MDRAEHKSEGKFRKAMFDHYARGDELYTYLIHRVDKRHKALVVDTKNGFEVFRRVAREEEPLSDNLKFELEQEFGDFVYNPGMAKNMKETRATIAGMDKRLADYREKIGRDMGDDLKDRVMQAILDEATSKEVDRSRIGHAYRDVKAFIDELYYADQSRTYTRRKKR